MNLRQKVIKGVFWSGIQSWSRQAIAFIIFSLLARLLEPETFGLVALAGVFLAFMEVFLDQGFSTAIIQRHDLEPEHLDTAFWTNILIGVLMTVFGIFAAGLVANLFNQPELTLIIRWLSLSFVIRALCAVQQSILQRNFDFKSLAVRSLAAVTTGGLVGIVMAFMGCGVWSLVGQYLTNGAVQVLVLWCASNWRPRFYFSRRHFKEFFNFGVNVVGDRFISFLNRRADDLLIGYFLGPIELGYYSVAYRILLIMTEMLSGIISQVIMPTFSRLQQDLERLRQTFYSAVQFTSLIAFPGFLGMAGLAPELVRVLFGERWLPSIPVMQILAFIGIIHSLGTFNGSLFISMGKPDWNLKIGFLNTVANLILFFIAVRWGITAVAAVYAGRGYLFFPIYLWAVKKLIHIKLATYFGQYVVPLVGTLVAIVTVLTAKYFLRDAISLQALLAVCSVLMAVVYVTTVILVSPKLFAKGLKFIRQTS